ncbi:hypothetical protein [Pseudothermotoga sp.]
MTQRTLASFSVILRKGFFKNEPFKMSILQDRIDFRCVEDKSHSFSVPFKTVNHISIYKTSNREIEIDTIEEVIFGNFKSNKSVHRAFRLLESLLKERVSCIEV